MRVCELSGMGCMAPDLLPTSRAHLLHARPESKDVNSGDELYELLTSLPAVRQFYTNARAQHLWRSTVRFVLTQRNRYTGLAVQGVC